MASGRINIAPVTQKLEVDNRISLGFYFLIADNILKEAGIFREEKNIIDLYILLLRFLGLASETIPYHKDYGASPRNKVVTLKKKLLNVLTELEELKPAVQQKISEMNSRHTVDLYQNISLDSSLEWPPVRKQTSTN